MLLILTLAIKMLPDELWITPLTQQVCFGQFILKIFEHNVCQQYRHHHRGGVFEIIFCYTTHI